MFVGHFAVGFGAKKFAPLVSLGVLFLAAQFLDLLWPTLVLLNLEHVAIVPGITRVTPLDFTHYPYSHSLVLVFSWGILFGLAYWLIRKNINNAIVLFVCVISHWLLDLLVHRPDLPLYPGDSPRLGFGLWNYPFLSFFLETSLFFTGITLYVRNTISNNRAGKYGLWLLVILLGGIYIGNLFGPPPPNVAAIAWAGHLQWIFVALGFWVDRNRSAKNKSF